jgi:hypothetical protein
MNSKDQFTSTLVLLADLTGKNMSTTLHDIYFQALEPYGIEKVNKILLSYVEEIKFPSVVQIKEKLGISNVDATDEEKARLLASKILRTIEKYGCSSPFHEQNALSQFSENEMKLVKSFMPWCDWCNENMVNYDNWSTIAAQFREYCKALGNQQRYDTHLEITSGNQQSQIIASLLDSKIQKQIDEIPF